MHVLNRLALSSDAECAERLTRRSALKLRSRMWSPGPVFPAESSARSRVEFGVPECQRQRRSWMTERPSTSLNPELNSIRSRTQPVIFPAASSRVCLVRPRGLESLPPYHLYLISAGWPVSSLRALPAHSPKGEMSVSFDLSERCAEVLSGL